MYFTATINRVKGGLEFIMKFKILMYSNVITLLLNFFLASGMYHASRQNSLSIFACGIMLRISGFLSLVLSFLGNNDIVGVKNDGFTYSFYVLTKS